MKLLERGSAVNTATLQRATGVSRRTLFRDLEALRAAGVALVYDRRRDRYQLEHPPQLSPKQITTDEAAALVVLAEQLAAGVQIPFFEPAAGAARKLQNELPPAMRQQVAELSAAITLVPGGVAHLEDKRHIFFTLLEARGDRRVLRMRYASLTEWETIETKLRPYQIVYSRHSWYVIGRSSMHGEVRTFKLSRIDSLQLLDETYSLPRGFSVRRYLRNAWRIVPEPGKDQHVVIRFSNLVATNVAEVVWHPTQRLEPQEDGSLLFHAKVSGVTELSWWVLGYGDQAEVLRPARLRKLVAERARSMARMYDR